MKQGVLGRVAKRANKPGLTLMEALAVISIIGILASLSIYVVGSALARGRDARRKSDLTAISLSFQTRYEAQTCSNPADVGYYPGRNYLPAENWKAVSVLANLSNDCGTFSEFLRTIPTNPNNNKEVYPYRFDLSHEPPPAGPIVGKHYRLSARLERTPNSNDLADLERSVGIWQNSFGGAPLPNDYNYLIGN